jgi:putative tricarboxylic transport membrane protein
MAGAIGGLLYVLSHFHFLFIGVVGGIIIGALPGLGGSVGIVLLLPFLLYVEPAAALIMMSGMFCGSMYGGSISAILISTPGTPSAVATTLDGYPLARQGKAGKAIAVSTISSATGGFISGLFLIFLAPYIAKFALKFGPEDYFALMIFGLTIMASVSAASLLKGFLSGFFGLMLALVGMDEILGTPRFTFGITRLLTGFPMVPVLIGLFAISEVFVQIEKLGKTTIPKLDRAGGGFPSWKEFKGLIKIILGSSVLGTMIGIIPATGGAIASFMAYNESRRFSKHPETFGKGNLAGVAAPEAANNGTTGGALVPLLTLGIPGDMITAVMLGALLLIGVRPGPLLFSQTPHIIRALFAGFMLAQLMIVGVGLACLPLYHKVVKIPIPILYPLVLALCFIGAYSLGNSVYDMLLSIVFGLIGYLLRRHGFSAAPIILGLILGPIAERELGRALMLSHGDWTVLLKSPIALALYGLGIASIAYSVLQFRRSTKKA